MKLIWKCKGGAAVKRLRAAAAIILVLLLLCAALPCAVLAAGEGESHETTVLFTHDLHSHFLPQTAADGGKSEAKRS